MARRRRPSRLASCVRIFVGCAALAGLALIPMVVIAATIAVIVIAVLPQRS